MKKLLMLSALAIFMVGCGIDMDNDDSGTNNFPYQAVAAKRPPACLKVGPAVKLPAAFPTQFPFPTGTYVTSASQFKIGVVSITALIPSNSLSKTAKFFTKQGKTAGFDVDGDDPTAMGAAGHDHSLEWTLALAPQCRNEIVMTLSSRKGGDDDDD